jgi:hypothetical protein
MENDILLKLILNKTSKIIKYEYDENEGRLTIYQNTKNIKLFYRKFKLMFIKNFGENKIVKLCLQKIILIFQDDLDIFKKMILAYCLIKCEPFINKIKTGIQVKFIFDKNSINNILNVTTDINFCISGENKNFIYFTSTKYQAHNLNYYLSDYLLLNHTNNFEICNDIFIYTLEYLINYPIENVECIRLPRLDLMKLSLQSTRNLLEVLKVKYFYLKLISFNFDIFLKNLTENKNDTIYSALEVCICLISFISKTFTKIFVIFNITFSNLNEHFPIVEFVQELKNILNGYSLCNKLLINIRCFCKVFLDDLDENSQLLFKNIFSVGKRVNVNKYIYRKKDYASVYLLLWLKKKSNILNKLKHETIFLLLSKFLEGYKVFTFDKFPNKNLEDNINTKKIATSFNLDIDLLEILKSTDNIDLTKIIIHNYTYNPLE